MKILHTSDWHLGKRTAGRSRLDEQRAALAEIAEIAEEEKADVILVAGDVFDTFVPPAEAEELFYSAVVKLAKTALVVAVAGNHDDARRLNAPAYLAGASGIALCDDDMTGLKIKRSDGTVVTGGENIPTNEGCFRSMKYILPEGSIVNATKPAPTGGRGLTVQLLSSTCLGALAKAKPELINACSGAYAPLLYIGGYDNKRHKPFVSNDNGMCGLGARLGKDGIDAISSDSQNVLAIPVEAFEMSGPLQVKHYGLADDSGGPGKYRGGLGSSKAIKLLDGEVSFTFRGDGFFVPPWGLFGGMPAKVGSGYILRADGSREIIPSKGDFMLYAGDEIGYDSAGGGGYGDPLERDPQKVLRDVLDERVSLSSALDDYGVCIDPVTKTVDEAVTFATRKQKQMERGMETWTYDRGVMGKE